MEKDAVVYSAHHDHLGIGAPAGTAKAAKGAAPIDTIYNGAIDNASGVATLLAIARAAMLSEPVKRTRVFLAVAAEEQGLLGIGVVREAPHVPGGAHRRRPQHRLRQHARPDERRRLHGVWAVVARRRRGRRQGPRRCSSPRKAYRSDQFSFAKVGVPGVFVRGGPSFVGRPEGWGRQEEALPPALVEDARFRSSSRPTRAAAPAAAAGSTVPSASSGAAQPLPRLKRREVPPPAPTYTPTPWHPVGWRGGWVGGGRAPAAVGGGSVVHSGGGHRR